MALEAVSVVFAVLIALGVDEWREDRANAQLAAQAIESIVTEIRGNQEEFTGANEANQAVITRLREAAADPDLREFGVQFEYSLLSEAAWQTAQMTRAATFIEYETVQRIARLYDLQTLFNEGQNGVLEFISGLGELVSTDPDRLPVLMLGRLQVVMELGEGLTEAYDSVLSELGGG
jgi:hypothetical protein